MGHITATNNAMETAPILEAQAKAEPTEPKKSLGEIAYDAYCAQRGWTRSLYQLESDKTDPNTAGLIAAWEAAAQAVLRAAQ